MRNLPSLGRLKQDSSLPEFWNSKPIPVGFCLGKALPFSVFLAAVGGRYAPDVEEAVRTFLSLTDDDRLAASERVFRQYREIVTYVPEVDLGVTESAMIWDHVRPTGVSVDRYVEGDGAVYVRLVFECDWEEEHGLQLVFRGGSAITHVGEHDDGTFVDDETR